MPRGYLGLGLKRGRLAGDQKSVRRNTAVQLASSLVLGAFRHLDLRVGPYWLLCMYRPALELIVPYALDLALSSRKSETSS